jgi:hypothetical protein
LALPIIAYTLFNKIRDKGKIVSARVWGQGGEMTQILYAHINKRKKIKVIFALSKYFSALL